MSPARPKLADPGALIRGAKHRTDTYKVCTDPDLIDQHARLSAERSRIVNAAGESLAKGDTSTVDARIAEVLAEIEAATVVLTFRSLPRPQYRAMKDKFPPRRNEQGEIEHLEDRIGVNFDPFFDELVRVSLVSPQLAEEDLTYLIEEVLSDRQWIEVTDVVWLLNERTLSIPFLSASSARTPTS